MFPMYRMFGRSRAPRHPRVLRLSALAVLLAILASACGSTPSPSFDPTGTCATDGRVPGAYPELEALVPVSIGDSTPISLDSGRNCSAANLGTLANHGVTEVRFAGSVWQDGSQSAITLAVFQAPGLEVDWIGEWYEAGARAGRVTGKINVTRLEIAGRPATRLDVINGESSQVVFVWPAPPGSAAQAGANLGSVVHVLIAADEPEARIQEALAAFP